MSLMKDRLPITLVLRYVTLVRYVHLRLHDTLILARQLPSDLHMKRAGVV